MKLKKFKKIYYGFTVVVDKDNEGEFGGWKHGGYNFMSTVTGLFRPDDERTDAKIIQKVYEGHDENGEDILKPMEVYNVDGENASTDIEIDKKLIDATRRLPFAEAKKDFKKYLQTTRTFLTEKKITLGRFQSKFVPLSDDYYEIKESTNKIDILSDGEEE